MLDTKQRLVVANGQLSRAQIALAHLEARDPHAALGVTGRRWQKIAEEAREEIARLRDVLALSRLIGGAA